MVSSYLHDVFSWKNLENSFYLYILYWLLSYLFRIRSHSQQKIKDIFTISDPENVKQIFDSLSRIAAFR